DVDHVDGLLRVTVDGRVGAVHAGHVVGAQDYLAPLGQRRGARVLELLVHDPLVIDHRRAPVGRGVADRVGGGVERAGDGGARTAHPGQVVGGPDDVRSDRVGGVDGVGDTRGRRTAVGRVLVGVRGGTGGVIRVIRRRRGRGRRLCGLGLVDPAPAGAQGESGGQRDSGDGGSTMHGHVLSSGSGPPGYPPGRYTRHWRCRGNRVKLTRVE